MAISLLARIILIPFLSVDGSRQVGLNALACGHAARCLTAGSGGVRASGRMAISRLIFDDEASTDWK
jgi:hypothetical protein